MNLGNHLGVSWGVLSAPRSWLGVFMGSLKNIEKYLVLSYLEVLEVPRWLLGTSGWSLGQSWGALGEALGSHMGTL